MPRPGPRRPLVALRMSTDGTEWVDQRAIEEGLLRGDGSPNRSEMIRLALKFAAAKMPKGWRPAGWKPSN